MSYRSRTENMLAVEMHYNRQVSPINDVARSAVRSSHGCGRSMQNLLRSEGTMLNWRNPWYDEMAGAMKTGKPYQAHLGPPADAKGNSRTLPQWLPGQPQPANWPRHIHPARGVTL